MHLRKFIFLSAVILCAWLAVTFVTDVPIKRYPKLDKHVRAGGPDTPEQEPHLVEADGETAEILHVTASH